MARTNLTKTSLSGAYAGATDLLTMTAADTTNQNAFTLARHDIVVIHNTDTGSHNITLTSADDPYGRQEDITESIGAGAIKAFGAVQLKGWLQSDGKFYLEADNAAVEFGILQQE